MAIFPNLELEETVQVFDKTRLNGTKSFISKTEAAVTLVRIKPESSGSFIDVTGSSSADWYLDWQFATAGTKTVTIEVTTDGSPETFTKDIEVVTETNDSLWSKDSDLVEYEHDILKWVRPGRNSFINVHRKAQKLIVDWMAQRRIFKNDGTRLVAADIQSTNEIKLLSTYWTLAIIFESISNKPTDVFAEKAKYYMQKVDEVKNSGRIEADFDGDATISTSETFDIRSLRIIR